MGKAGVFEKLVGFLRVHAGGAYEDQREDERGYAGDGVGGRGAAWVQAREPLGDEMVPTGRHGESRNSGEEITGGSEETELEQEDDEDGGYVADS